MPQKKQRITINPLLKVLNISEHELSRIIESWLVRLFYQVGFVIGWTMLTALIVNQFGIKFLPMLYIANGILIVIGSLVYSKFIALFKNRVLIMGSCVAAALILFFAVYFFQHDIWYFLVLTLIAISIFIGQLYIIILSFIEELFTPMENQRANPIIETSEPIGGIIAGIILVAFAGSIAVEHFTYFWLAFFLAIIPTLVVFYRRKHKVVRLVAEQEEQKKESLMVGTTLERGIKHVKAMPFVRGLAIVIFCHWIFVNLLNYQYTKAVDANVSHSGGHHVEESVEHEVEHSMDAHGVEGGAVASTGEEALLELDFTDTKHIKEDGHRAPSTEHEDALTHGLGTLHIIFSLGMLIMQLFFSSRIVQRLGIVRAIQLQPGISFFTVLAMIANFSFVSAIIAKGVFEALLVVENNAYHNSYYAIFEYVREQVREFIEGIVRPFGVIIGTLLLLAVTFWLPSDLADYVINISMAVIMIIMVFTLLYMKDRYTQLSKKNMDILGEHPEKFNAIEILSQKGHEEASNILTKNLIYKKESARTKIKILKALADIHDEDAMPEILAALEDENMKVRFQACKTLASFENLGSKFYTQTFAKHRVLHALTEQFKKEKSRIMKSAIIEVFASIHHEDIVPFLLERLEKEDDLTKAQIIMIIGMFKDINAGYYLEKHLQSKSSRVRANTIIALWNYKKYRLKLLVYLTAMLDDHSDRDTLISGIYALGETKSIQEIPKLLTLMKKKDVDIKRHAAVALAKMDKSEAVDTLIELLMSKDHDLAMRTKNMLSRVDAQFIKLLNSHLSQEINAELHRRFKVTNALYLDDLSIPELKDIKHYFELLDNEKEVIKVESVIKHKEKPKKEKDTSKKYKNAEIEKIKKAIAKLNPKKA